MKKVPYKLVFRVHAIKRMFQRGIGVEEVLHVLDSGKVIEEYPHDTPYPSKLISGESNNRPVHVVIAENFADGETIVITVYEPSSYLWEPGFGRRKK